MAALLSGEPLVPAATAAFELHLPWVAVACLVLTVAALFWWGIRSLSFLFGRRPAERELLYPTGAAAAGTTASASRSQPLHFVVLCFVVGAALHAEPLVAAAAELRLHPGVVICVVLAVTAFFYWAIVSLNFLVARRPAEREPKVVVVLRPTPPDTSAGSPHLARSAFLVLAVLTSASWFIETFAAAAELRMPGAVVVAFLFAALFNLSIHLFRSFFLPRPPLAVAATAQGHGVGAIAAAVVGMGI